MSDTELRLRDWRQGPIQSERLVAVLLALDGYTSIDPQHPLGGPDGGKDVLCKRDGIEFVAASYFPPTQPSLSEVRKKFRSDLSAARRHGRPGFAFFVNQQVAGSLRDEMIASGRDGEVIEPYHVERMAALLDRVSGYGYRFEYLGTRMSEAEERSFWNHMNSLHLRQLQAVESDRDSRLERLERKVDEVVTRTNAIGLDLTRTLSSLSSPVPLSTTSRTDAPTRYLSIPIVRWVHAIVMDGAMLPIESLGELRAINVWLGESGVVEPVHIPPAPDQVPVQLYDLLSAWVAGYERLTLTGRDEIIAALARFHWEFVRIHPFVDGNGRVARYLIDQAAQELLGRRVTSQLTSEPSRYYRALRSAGDGDLEPLRLLLASAIE